MDVGSQFGPYRLDALVGRGGMGRVFRAYDTVRDREVALKLLKADLASDETFQERFRRESQTAAKLGEPHIIPIHDYGEIDGVLYLDMRLVDGRDLREVLRGDGPMAPSAAVALIEQIASALDAAHAVGLVHRDVKPENVLVTPGGFAYLVDFGIAHHAGDAHLTRTGTAVGSIAYMAPEQLDNVPVGPASDVYSLAAVLFELLTGRQPYPGDSVSAVVKATVLSAVPAPSSISPAVTPALDAVVMRGLAKSPGERFPSAGEFAAAARAAVEGAPLNPAFDATQIGAPLPLGTKHYSGPQNFSGPQHFSGPQMTNPISPQGYPQQPYPQQSYPGGQPYGAAYVGGQPAPPGNDDSRVLNIVLAVFAAVLVVALIGLAVYWFGFRDPDGVSTSSSSTTTITNTVQPQTSTMTVAPSPPPGTASCGGGVGVATSVTSCEFAANVGAVYLQQGPKGEARTIVASSPVTGDSYTMSCTPETGVVVCRGGNNAVVVIY
ncbi:serine/threonine-protein kinase [Gordonia sp. MP11Mi]